MFNDWMKLLYSNELTLQRTDMYVYISASVLMYCKERSWEYPLINIASVQKDCE